MFDARAFFESRRDARSAFLQSAGWGDSILHPLAEDWAARRYIRLARADGRRAVLMEAVPDSMGAATPGHRLGDFIRIGGVLEEKGFRVPAIFEQDAEQGYLILEDFGDETLLIALQNGMDEGRAYAIALDPLIAFRDCFPSNTLSLPLYRDSHIHKARRRVVDWYLPLVLGRKNPDGLAEDYLSVWDKIESELEACPQGFLHGDYHVRNLMHLSDGRCGILDFQGAMWGPVLYDLSNLLEDARIDMGRATRAALFDRYAGGLQMEPDAARSWYRVLATQFHCRLAGQVMRMALLQNKAEPLSNLARIQGYLRFGLSQPVLKPLKDWFAAQGLTFKETIAPDAEQARTLIRQDAV